MKYAAYGSNLHPIRLSERISSARCVSTGFLPGWSLRWHKRSHDGSGKCSISPGGEGVHLAIFEISASDKYVLDEIEGVNVGYSNSSLSIPGVGECMSYVAQETHIDDSLKPYDWYREFVLLGARFHGFPDEYLKQIESVQTHADPDPDRSLREWKSVELVKAGR